MRNIEIGPHQWHEKFKECLGKEFSDEEYFSVHHLLVLCYMIQCNAYNNKHKEKVYKILKDFIDGKEPKEIMIENKKLFNGKNKAPILKNENEKSIFFDKWEKTIMDIRTDNAKDYCQDIKDWAFEVEKILNKEYSNKII
ncbi:MAG: DUF5946 family protein [Treponema sp.]|nr:DUF5946 family protein [Treponema sp.]